MIGGTLETPLELVDQRPYEPAVLDPDGQGEFE